MSQKKVWPAAAPPAKNFYEIYLKGGASPREILTESTPRFNGQGTLESTLTSNK